MGNGCGGNGDRHNRWVWEVYINYVLTQGDSIKTGELEVLCPAGDTTEYVLQLFD